MDKENKILKSHPSVDESSVVEKGTAAQDAMTLPQPPAASLASGNDNKEQVAVSASKYQVASDTPENSNEHRKRSIEEEVDSDEAAELPEIKRLKSPMQDIVDMARMLGLQSGDRIEVQWDCEMGPQQENKTHWWGATLLPHDGRGFIEEDPETGESRSVAVRVLAYDAYPEGGFPEPSEETVLFVSSDSLLDFSSRELLTFRLSESTAASADSITRCRGKEDIEAVVNEVLNAALNKNSALFQRLPGAQQALIAEQIALKKEKLVEKLSSQTGALVDSQTMKSILADIMRDD